MNEHPVFEMTKDGVSCISCGKIAFRQGEAGYKNSNLWLDACEHCGYEVVRVED